jgi:predicted nucleotidyltransferase
MRLSAAETEIITRLTRESFGDAARVFLFGSRTDDAARGGDIDLYIETPLDTQAVLPARLKFEAGLILALGERKLDVVVKPVDRPPTPFEQHARTSGVAL